MSGSEFMLYAIGFLYVTLAVLLIVFSIYYLKNKKDNDDNQRH
jgi:cbb3-type cytochrome oxidase subunit 3